MAKHCEYSQQIKHLKVSLEEIKDALKKRDVGEKIEFVVERNNKPTMNNNEDKIHNRE